MEGAVAPRLDLADQRAPSTTTTPHWREPGLRRRSGREAAMSGLLVVAVAVIVAPLERFPEWDEAVFLGQSGGLDGRPAPRPSLVASREIGSAMLLRTIRAVTDTLANTRLLWILAAVAALCVGSWLLSRWTRTPPALLILSYGTFWLALMFMGTFMGFFLASVMALVAAGAYLGLRAAPEQQARWGVLLGVSLASALWLRQIESALVVACFLLHLLVVSPREVLAHRWRGRGIAAATLTATFVIPWIVDSTVRFGSVQERISLAQAQDFGRGVSNQLLDYANVLRGWSHYYDRFGPPPTWAVIVITGLLLLVLVAAAIEGVRARRASLRRDDHDDGGGRPARRPAPAPPRRASCSSRSSCSSSRRSATGTC
jgi:hypothetical protein